MSKPARIPKKRMETTDLGFPVQEESALFRKAKRTFPNRTYVETRFKFEHVDFGDLEIDLLLDQDNILVIAMKKLLKTRTLRCTMFGGSIIAELVQHSKLRVKSIRRLRGKP